MQRLLKCSREFGNTCSWLYVFVQHDVLIAGIAVEMLVEFYARCPLKWITLPIFFIDPIAQFYDVTLFRGKVEVVGSVEDVQHIQVIAQPPIIGIGAALGGQVGRVYQEANPVLFLPLTENLPVVFVDYDKPVKIMVG